MRTKPSGSGEAFMIIVGCDFHPSWQQVAIFDSSMGEIVERKLVNGNGEAERFYRSLPVPSRIGLESCGNSQWFVELVEQLGHEVWIGDAAQIRASYVRKQKTDKRDAAHMLTLLIEGRFPRLWVPDATVRDLRQLLIHRHKLVEIRARVKNGLQHLAMNRGMQKKSRLWSEAGQKAFDALPLEGWAACRREDLQRLGAISKQGNGFARMLLVEAAHMANRLDEGFRKQYQHRCHTKPKGVAKVAAARKLAVRLYWMLRSKTPYPEIVRIESSPRVPLVGES
ncbi:MAG: transposase [Acidobacteriota bacterium]|nr:transposase [Acidobacteriota bacterium]